MIQKPFYSERYIFPKAGTSTLTNESGISGLRAFDRLACVLSDIQNMGWRYCCGSKLYMKERLFEDDDILSAVVAVLCKTKQLVILSYINGL